MKGPQGSNGVVQLSLITMVAAVALALGGCTGQDAGPVLATKPGVGKEVAAAAADKLEIKFPRGGAWLSPEAGAQLDVAARLYRDVNPVEMFSMGYTDATGDEFSNVLLAARRARAVKAGLVARGIPANRVSIQAFGESAPANASDPKADENRRVIVKWRVI